MPLYEYVCEKDGTVVELLRSARDADEPVSDPEGRGRVYKRRMSTFATSGNGGDSQPSRSLVGGQSMCPCGKRRGGCGS